MSDAEYGDINLEEELGRSLRSAKYLRLCDIPE